ncbi:MAG: aminodeoxychorismate synthase component I [Ignavibacteriales bacterium]|nr:aminodeoxychorismate synthase component I [Ignavibacteriales bacterium]
MVRKLLSERKGIASASSRNDSGIYSGGAVGYVSYDYGMTLENISSRHSKTNPFPEIFFGLYDSALCFNHQTKEWSLNSIESFDFAQDKLRAESVEKLRITNYELQSQTTIHKPQTHFLIPDFKRSEYCDAVHKIKNYIANGDVYQVNLSHRFWGKTGSSALTIYNSLRENNPAPFSAMMCLDEKRFVFSSSPELFFSINGNEIETRPIKGTIRRGKTLEEDELFKNQLLESKKDEAELLMIVDLERNDLNKVCEKNSVRVENLKRIETYETVHHLVADVKGTLRKDKDTIDVLKAMFPGGSITGAPKIRAMEIIDELEKCRRGIYTGATGWIGFDGNAKFNIAIRTMMMENDSVWFNVGGGIVADSIAEKEFEETMHKADGMLRALNVVSL